MRKKADVIAAIDKAKAGGEIVDETGDNEEPPEDDEAPPEIGAADPV